MRTVPVRYNSAPKAYALGALCIARLVLPFYGFLRHIRRRFYIGLGRKIPHKEAGS